MKLPALVVAVAVMLLGAGCSGRAAHGPAWPRPHDKLADGGESLAPRVANPITAAAAAGDDVAIPEITPAVAVPATPAATPATPTAAPAVKPPDDPVMTEELIIEIDD